MKHTIWEWMEIGSQKGASDIHIISGLAPKCRVDGEITDLGDEVLTAEECDEFAKTLAGEEYVCFNTCGEWDGAAEIDGLRCRINIFRQRKGVSIVIRLLRNKIPVLSELSLPPAVETLSSLKDGIVLVTGATGSGKSTTLAAILDEINHTRRGHILTLEDPVEYVYTPDLCIINQREIGRDTKSYPSGLHTALREDPDVILIGEMRDQETIRTALTAAETGHLVFATLHSGSSADAVNRIIDVFSESEQAQVRVQLASTLRAVLVQRLLPRMSGSGRVAACELMLCTPAVKNLIREGKTTQLANAILTSASEGSVTLDNSLIKLFKERKISAQTARENAADADYVKRSTMF